MSLPEPRSKEAHEHVKRLRAELYRLRAEKPGSGYTLDAFIRYMHEAALLGLSPTALAEYSPIEEDRFFTRVIEGPDGHRYWHGRDQRFTGNDKRTRHPRRWWWEREHGITLNDYDDLAAGCGDTRCIAPTHMVTGRSAARRRHTDQHMLGGLQVLALRLGHTPSMREWDKTDGEPSGSNYRLRFGSWVKAVRAAGLEPHGRGRRP